MLVWPSISEMKREGTKHEWIRQLDRIALLLGTPRPHTQELTPDTIPTNGGKWVIKREFSANHLHVQTVDLEGLMSEAARKLEVFEQVWKDNRFSWIIQSHVPFLERWGEWRVFLIGGKAKYIAMTTKSSGTNRELIWSWNKVDQIYTLNTLT
jgi:hypothetical protein